MPFLLLVLFVFFEERGHSKTDIQMKVLDLQDQEKIVEIELGKYVIGGK